MGLGIVEFFMAVEERFNINLSFNDKEARSILTLGDFIDYLILSLQTSDQEKRSRNAVEEDTFQKLKEIYAETIGNDKKTVTRDTVCFIDGISHRRRARFVKRINHDFSPYFFIVVIP